MEVVGGSVVSVVHCPDPGILVGVFRVSSLKARFGTISDSGLPFPKNLDCLPWDNR